MTSDRPDVDAIVATFPIDDFARLMKIPAVQVRETACDAVRNAIANGGYPYNVGKVMRYAIEAAQR